MTTTTTTTADNNLREDGGGTASDPATDTNATRADGNREEPRVYSKSMRTVPSKWRQKSKSNLKRKSTVDDIAKSALIETQIEPIATSVVGLDDLRDGYYSDLRALLPPPPVDLLPAAAECAVDVNARLREMHDAIDEIDRALWPLSLLLTPSIRPRDRVDPDRSPDGFCPEPNASSSSECDKAEHASQTLPRRTRLRKPNVAGRPEIYRVEEKAFDWTTAQWCEIEKRPLWTGVASELRADDGSSTTSSAPLPDDVSSTARAPGVPSSTADGATTV